MAENKQDSSVRELMAALEAYPETQELNSQEKDAVLAILYATFSQGLVELDPLNLSE